jgi:undecaprenyl phosphate-alpha-L-ara4N flippase subunit ArnE
MLLLLNGSVIAGVVAWAVATLLWVVVLNRAPLAHVYVLGSLNYIAVPLLSRWFLAEQLSRLQLIGMVIIAIGVLLSLVGRIHATA